MSVTPYKTHTKEVWHDVGSKAIGGESGVFDHRSCDRNQAVAAQCEERFEVYRCSKQETECTQQVQPRRHHSRSQGGSQHHHRRRNRSLLFMRWAEVAEKLCHRDLLCHRSRRKAESAIKSHNSKVDVGQLCLLRMCDFLSAPHHFLSALGRAASKMMYTSFVNVLLIMECPQMTSLFQRPT